MYNWEGNRKRFGRINRLLPETTTGKLQSTELMAYPIDIILLKVLFEKAIFHRQ